jgi:membrane associated rhomboid family serine protease
MIPIKDNIPTRTFPIITASLLVVNIVAFVYARTMPVHLQATLIKGFGLIPREFLLALSTKPELLPYNVLTIFTSMFLHAGFLHLGGNMLYLWIFGNNIEDAVGHVRFIFFYGLSGIAAAVMQFLVDPTSMVPMIGASGAVSGVLGGYLMLFPRAKIKTLIFIFIFFTFVDLPAMLLLTVWFLIQVLYLHTDGVAWFAHIGGFLFGLITIRLFTLGRTVVKVPRGRGA